MLGITYHNPATISVFLDRLRFRDCFVSSGELKDGTWADKLRSFTQVPRDGRDQVVFVETIAGVRTMVREGASFDGVRVAVYDEAGALENVPGCTIVDAHVNGTNTWQLYRVSFEQFNDALASEDPGVSVTVAPPPEPAAAETTEVAAPVEPDPPAETKSEEAPVSVQVMEQIVSGVTSDDTDEEEPAGPRVLIPKGRGPDPIPEDDEEEEEEEAEPAPEPEPEPVVEEAVAEPPAPEPKKGKGRKTKPKLDSFQLF